MTAVVLALVVGAAAAAPRAAAPLDPPSAARLETPAGAALPPGAALVDERGSRVRFGDLLGRRPLLLLPVYYGCSAICSLAQEGLLRALRPLSATAGRDFDVLVLSFDPRDGPAAAAERKRAALREYGRAGAEAGWRFWTGPGAAELLRAAGYEAAYDPRAGEYAHPAALFVLGPSGRVARVFSTIEPAPRDLRLALAEASEGRTGSWLDRATLLCYRWDPAAHRYGPSILAAVRALGALTLLGLIALVAALSPAGPWRRT